MVEQNLQTEMLMGLIFSSDNENDEIHILKESIPVYLRKLNCFIAGVLKKTELGFSEVMLLPYVAKKTENWKNVKSHFVNTSINNASFAVYNYKNSNYYAYNLNSYGILILGRKNPFNKTLANELKPVVNHFGKKLALANEIEQRKIAEKKLIKAKEEAEKSDKLKSAFLANISHEIRTPMNGVLGFSELLKTPNLSDSKKEKYIEVIEKSGQRMLSLINDIVDFSKIEADLMKITISKVNINEQIDSVYDFFKPEAASKNLMLLKVKNLNSTKAIISTDLDKLFAILTNLVKNAIKYTDKGSIEIGYYLKTYNQKQYVEFYVKDTGIGINKKNKNDVFKRFIQANIDDMYTKQGAGLGLSISKAYVEMLGGKIWVESKENIGSTFYFSLPFITP